MAHSAVWGHPRIQRQNTKSKKLTIEKLSKSGLRKCTKFSKAHLNFRGFCILFWISGFNIGDVIS